jgi:hypothetical protein
VPQVKVSGVGLTADSDSMKPVQRITTGLLALLTLAAPGRATAQSGDEFEQAPIRYSATAPKDPIAKLEARLHSGDLKLPGDDRAKFERLLRELDIPVESQVIVFAKTSFQRDRIKPSTPRAIFFNDEVYLGWVPGGLFEVASMDPELGPIFYGFDPHEETVPNKARFGRDEDCLRCHGGQFVRGIPSVFVRSVHSDEGGDPLLKFGSEVVDHRTPFNDRWGGWYVTGLHGQALHRGNVFVREEKGELVADYRRGANVTNLAPYFDVRPHLTNTSDIVALMVMEHQLATQNALTKAAFAARRMLHYQQSVQRDLKEVVSEEPTYDSVRRVIENAAQDVVDHLLFKDEAPLPPGGIQGSPGFQKVFTARGKRTPAGESLRDLELKQRLFRNRCSYLIDSPQFLALPKALKERIYARLAKALQPVEPDARYAYLPAEERARIVAVLRENHRGLPANWLAN